MRHMLTISDKVSLLRSDKVSLAQFTNSISGTKAHILKKIGEKSPNKDHFRPILKKPRRKGRTDGAVLSLC